MAALSGMFSFSQLAPNDSFHHSHQLNGWFVPPNKELFRTFRKKISEFYISRKDSRIRAAVFLYNENHSLSERFKKAYGDKEKSLLKLLSGLPAAQ